MPVLLEIGKESVYGDALDELLDEASRALIEEATGETAETAEKTQRRLL